MRPEPLEYEAPKRPDDESAASPRRPSWYGVLAVVVLSLDLLWFFAVVLGAPYGQTKKPTRIFCAAWLLGLSAVIVAYSQKGRSPTWAHVGAAMLVVDLLLTALLPTF